MKLAILSSTFPPDICGVGDASAGLAMAWKELGSEVKVFTSRSHERLMEVDGLKRAIPDIRNFRPEALLIQYTPYHFSPPILGRTLGIHRQFKKWWNLLRREVTCPILIWMHELHYPFNLSFKGILLGAPQWYQYQWLLHRADRALFSTESLMRNASTQFPHLRSKIGWLPPGSNIQGDSDTSKLTIRDDSTYLIHFGGLHPTRLLDWTLETLRLANRTPVLGKTALVFVGVTKNQLQNVFGEFREDSIHALGVLPANEVAQWLKRGNALISPFLDGVSSRRSSVIAALEHGCPVITNLGKNTDPSIPWSEITLASEATSAEKFAQFAIQSLLNQDLCKRTSLKAQEFFHRFFSWEVLARRLRKEVEMIR